jgi:L-seryl-tRNA(Ser) seleniumtransferase
MAGGDRSLSDDGAIVARIESLAAARLDEQFQPSLQPAINATGIIIHTNLGRAPLAEAAVERVASVARGYSTLEYDIAGGGRGRRDVHAEALLCRLTGAEAAVVVNNNAAATMIVLAAVATGREVIVSRGELVEIGGGFRVPDVLAQSGAILREVGTTNRTRAADYAAAIGERTGLILRVHPSNFRIEGFTERPGVGELVDLGSRFGVPVAEDLGSGYLGGSVHASPAARADPLAYAEPGVEASVAAGVGLCCFSGDKLLGGPQAGLLLGDEPLVRRLLRHPLARALRVDKLTLAALEATITGPLPPVARALAADAASLTRRAERIVASLAPHPVSASVVASEAAVGGGGAPGVTLPSAAVALPGELAPLLRYGDAVRRGDAPAVAGRLEKGLLLLDLRSVAPEDDDRLIAAVAAAAARRPAGGEN